MEVYKKEQSMADLIQGIKMPDRMAKARKENMVYETYLEVKKFLNFDEKSKYGKGYWLGVIKRSGILYTEIFGLIKEVENAPAKFPKDRLLTKKILRLK